MTFAASTNAPRVNQSTLARMLEVSRQSINELVKNKVIPVGDDGLIDLEQAKAALLNRVRPSGKTTAAILKDTPAAAPVAAPAQPQDQAADPIASDDQQITSYHVAKTLREAAEAQMAQIKLQEMRGDLVRTAEVKAQMASRIIALREATLQIPARIVPLLAHESDPTKIHAIIDAELRQMLAMVANLDASNP